MNISSYASLRQQLLVGTISCSNIVEHYLNNIKLNEHLNAFLEVFETEAIERASKLDAQIKKGNTGKLTGMVIGLKDNICYKGHKVSAASKILEGFESLYSSTAVERLEKEGAIFIGRLNCDEFAMGSSNENSAFGPVKNPHDNSKVTGGSSGGSAAAVASDCCMVALGSDTGGSIRQPASFTGLVGVKPTYGRVSRHGLIAYGSSLDQIGSFSKNVADSSIVLEVIAGPDEFDATASTKPIDNYSDVAAVSEKKKIVVLQEPLEHDKTDSEIKEKVQELINKLQEQGHEVVIKSMPLLDYLVPCYYVISNAEASSNLSRYDGVHIGYRSPAAFDMESTYVKSRTEGFGTEVKRRIMLGTFVLSAGYYDAYFSKAQKVRRKIQDYTNQLLTDADFVISPTTPNTAFEIGAKSDPIEMYLQDIFTVHANLSGNPAISLPMGKHSNGLPFGIQVLAPHFAEKQMFDFSEYLMNKF